MPILETTDNIMPRSALRHRPIADKGASATLAHRQETGKQSMVDTAVIPAVQRASRTQQRAADTHDEIDEWHRVTEDTKGVFPSSIQSHLPAPNPVRRASVSAKRLPKTPLAKAPTIPWRGLSLRGAHPLLYLGIGMLSMLVLWIVLSSVTSWYNTMMDDLHYGRPRTYQVDAFVGHNESSGVPSHFIAINLHGHIEIIELPGGDGSHARIYMGPQLYNAGSDLIPVTLTFIDINGDHMPDMIITIQGSQIVYINDQGGFRPLRPEERHHVEQFLQHLGH